jgi:hypothetical protein
MPGTEAREPGERQMGVGRREGGAPKRRSAIGYYSVPLSPALQLPPGGTYSAPQYVAVDSDPDSPSGPGDRMLAPGAGGADAAATQ